MRKRHSSHWPRKQWNYPGFTKPIFNPEISWNMTSIHRNFGNYVVPLIYLNFTSVNFDQNHDIQATHIVYFTRTIAIKSLGWFLDIVLSSWSHLVLGGKRHLSWYWNNVYVLLQVVVILIICVISLLVLYMLFLLCLDPLMSRRPKTYLEQRNEEVNLVTIGTKPTRPPLTLFTFILHYNLERLLFICSTEALCNFNFW